MNIKKYILLLVVIGITSCKNTIELNNGPEAFKVSTDKPTYKLGETVKFIFEGDPGIITLFSGQPQNDYAFKDGRTIDAGTIRLSFSSSVTGGTQVGQLAVLVSTDFNGDYSSFATVQAATWTNITSRFALGTTTTVLASGIKDITDLKVAGRPLYVAFKYVTKPQATNGLARTWTVQNVLMTGVTDLGLLTIGDMNSIGFRVVDQNPLTLPAKSTVAATTLQLLGHTFNAANDLQSENWIVSSALNTDKINLGPDRPVAVKANSDSKILEYNYSGYTTAGRFKAYFVATNVNIDQSKTVAREVTVTIQP